MKNYLVAERYAKALCNSLENDALDGATEALECLTEIYRSSEALRNVLSSPAIELHKRRDVLRDVLAAAEIDGPVARMAEVLVLRGRITLLPDVTTVFGMFADERQGRVRATVITAVEPTSDQEERLKQALVKWSGKDVRIQREVNPDILGGVIAKVAGAVIDGSIRTRIERLREELLAHDIRAENAT